MTENERIYMAGIVDARMRFRVRGNGSFELSIYCRERELADLIRKLANCGGVYAQGSGWRWNVSDAVAIRDFLAKVDPHVVVKKKAIYAVEAAADERHRLDKRRKENRIAQKRTAR